MRFSTVFSTSLYVACSWAFLGIRQANPNAPGSTFTINPPFKTGNASIDAAGEIAAQVLQALFTGDIQTLEDHLIAPDYLGVEAPGMPYNNSIYSGFAGLERIPKESAKIWAFNHTTLSIFPMTPEFVLVKMWDPTAISAATNETVPYDVLEEVYIKDGKYVLTKPYYWDQYGYMKANIIAQGDNFVAWQDNVTESKRAELEQYSPLFAGN